MIDVRSRLALSLRFKPVSAAWQAEIKPMCYRAPKCKCRVTNQNDVASRAKIQTNVLSCPKMKMSSP